MKIVFLGGLRPFNPKVALRDVVSGVTLASMNIPQVLGYARIAGMPLVTGLYTVLLPILAFAVFGSSRHLVVAADSATAVIFSGSLTGMAAPASEKYVALVGMVALLTAGILLLAPDVTWSEALALVPVAASCFAMIIAQSAATSYAFALRYHESVDEDADILGLSVANAVAAFSGAFVVNGSPTQTAMADRAGARSQIAQLAFAGVVLVVLLFLTGPLQHLPRCVLASIVFTIAVGMIDLKGLRNIRRESPGEFYLAVVTAAAVVAVGVEQGILLAIALSILRHVRHSYRPHALLLGPDVTGRWVPGLATPGKETEPGLIVYRFGSDLFFANAKRFGDQVRALVDGAPTPVRWFVVDASVITDIDYSAAQSIRDFIDELKRRRVQIVFARVSPYLRSDMDRHHITDAVGEEWTFATLHEAMTAIRERSPLSPPSKGE
jgi:sulfate permease, SulP family